MVVVVLVVPLHTICHADRFKLIPSVVSGPFIVRKAVGNKPALLGRKVSQRYFRGPGYVETDVGEPAILR